MADPQAKLIGNDLYKVVQYTTSNIGFPPKVT